MPSDSGTSLNNAESATPPRRSLSHTKLSSLSLFGESQVIHHLASKMPQCRHEARMTFKTIVRDYCNHTAIHGFRYFFDSTRAPSERAFWVFAVFLSLGGCFYLMSKVWMKWELYPVMVTFRETTNSGWEFPFPAVTICPVVKAKKHKFDYTETYQRIMDKVASPEEIWKFGALSMVCEIEEDIPHPKTRDRINRHPIDFLFEVAPTLEEVLFRCYWQNRLINCSDIFRTVLTTDGVCFTFNSLSARDVFRNGTVQWEEGRGEESVTDWSEEGGYVNTDSNSYPRRQVGVGAWSGLQVILSSNTSDNDHLCKVGSRGYKVTLHSPAQVCGQNQFHTLVPHNSSMHVVVSTSLMTTSESLRYYPQQRRACIFATEQQPRLRFYKLYSQDHCIYECVANLTLLHCNCTVFNFPRAPWMQVCDQYSDCVIRTIETIVNNHTGGEPQYTPIPACNACLPSCFAMSYSAHTSTTEFNWEEAARARRIKFMATGSSVSILRIYPQTMQFITSQRREMYGHTDFLANCGGLLGLFSGFSVVSLVEILYYMSLRLVCHIRRRADCPNPHHHHHRHFRPVSG